MHTKIRSRHEAISKINSHIKDMFKMKMKINFAKNTINLSSLSMSIEFKWRNTNKSSTRGRGTQKTMS